MAKKLPFETEQKGTSKLKELLLLPYLIMHDDDANGIIF